MKRLSCEKPQISDALKIRPAFSNLLTAKNGMNYRVRFAEAVTSEVTVPLPLQIVQLVWTFCNCRRAIGLTVPKPQKYADVDKYHDAIGDPTRLDGVIGKLGGATQW